MRKNVFLFLLVLTVVLLFSSCYSYTRIGDLTMISTRNIDSNVDYELIERYVEGRAKSNTGDALQKAIDNAVRKVPDGGEFLKNARIYVRSDGKRVKVEGDVWGFPSVKRDIQQFAKEDIQLKVGDNVFFTQRTGRRVTGKIIGLNPNFAVIEYTSILGIVRERGIEYNRITKVQ